MVLSVDVSSGEFEEVAKVDEGQKLADVLADILRRYGFRKCRVKIIGDEDEGTGDDGFYFFDDVDSGQPNATDRCNIIRFHCR
jgi:hypothetical protein